MSKQWQFREDEPFIEKTSRPWMQTVESGAEDYEEGWRTYIIYDGTPAEVTWFPERMGVQIESPGTSELGEKKGHEVALLGLTLIKLIRSGAHCVKEI